MPMIQTITAFPHRVYVVPHFWTEYPSPLPGSVISPRAWIKMWFQLITHLISFGEFLNKSRGIAACLICVNANTARSPIEIHKKKIYDLLGFQQVKTALCLFWFDK